MKIAQRVFLKDIGKCDPKNQNGQNIQATNVQQLVIKSNMLLISIQARLFEFVFSE